MDRPDAPTVTHPPTEPQTAAPARSGDEPALSQAGPFTIEAVVGRGGMGVVYRARDLALDRDVAVKVLQQRYPPGSATAARFLDEARITGQLQHPGIPAVHAVGTLPDGRPYLVMKLIKGRTLDRALKEAGPLDTLAVFEAVCQAVAYAHAHGVLHRDLKPANVMVGSFGEVQVMDWGLAKVLGETTAPGTVDPSATTAPTEIRSNRDSDGSFTEAGAVLGTPAFMAPEQAAGQHHKVDARSDVFGLGALLCALLTGQPPYVADNGDEVRVLAMRGQTADALARLDACGADPGLLALCQRCLSFERDDRPTDAGAVAAAVAELRRAAEERARRAEIDRAQAEVRAAEERKRRRLAATLIGTVTLALVAAGAVWLWLGQQRAVARAQVEDAVGQAGEMLAKHNLIDARRNVDRAGALLDPAGRPADLTRQVEDRTAEVDVAERLEKIRNPEDDDGSSSVVRPRSDRDYARLFREIDHDVDALDADEVARRIEARPLLKPYFLLALADWTTARLLIPNGAGKDWRRLLDVSARLDPEPWRDQLRDRLKHLDLPALKQMALTADTKTQPPSTLLLLATALLHRTAAGELLYFGGDRATAVALLRRARWDHPGDYSLHSGLGYCLRMPRAPDEVAEALSATACAAALRPRRTDWVEHGNALYAARRFDEAILAAERTLAINPESFHAYPLLANAYRSKGQAEKGRQAAARGVEAMRGRLRRDATDEAAWFDLGYCLIEAGRCDEAVPAIRKALELNPAEALPLSGQLRECLERLARLDDGARHARDLLAKKLIRTAEPEVLHNNLAYYTLIKGEPLAPVDEAITEALRIAPERCLCHLTLAEVRQAQGRFAESLAAYRRGLELQPNSPVDAGHPIGDWIKDAERLVERDRLLPGVLAGEFTPKTAAGHLEYARACVCKQLHASALQLHRDAFKLDPKAEAANCYQAARCALLLAEGRGPEAAKLTDAEKAALRREALGWLRADLGRWKQAPRMAGLTAVNHCDTHDDLLSVRDPARRQRLPADEQQEWAAFWADVTAFRQAVNQLPEALP